MANTVVNAWTVSPTRRCVEVPPPVAEKVTSFGHRVVARAFSYDVVLLACCCLCSVMPDSATPWTAAHQAPRSMGFPRQEHWSGPPFLLQGIFPTPGSNPCLLRLLHYRQILYCWAIRESRVALIQYDWCPYKKAKSRHRDMHGGEHHEHEIGHLQAKGDNWNRSFPHSPQKEPVLLTPHLQEDELLLFKSPGWWYLVTAANTHYLLHTHACLQLCIHNW